MIFAALLTINALASLVAAGFWRLLSPTLASRPARWRADVLFALRMSAPAVALACVAFLILPSYLTYEPYSTTEVVSTKLAVLAIISLAGIAFAVWRAVQSWVATRTLRRQWLAVAVRTDVAGINIPTFCFPHSFPVLAVIGTLRPRLFIAENVLSSLSDEELAAAIAHECGHLVAYDNFKRSLLRACRDLLWLVPFGRFLDRLWAEAAECAADERAARENPLKALALASALVKIARMVPAGNARMPAAAFLVDINETRGIKGRIRRLLFLASIDGAANRPAQVHILAPLAFCAFFGLGLFCANSSQALEIVHGIIEKAVHFLS